MMVDDNTVSIGSFNFDNYSWYVNNEVNVEVKDK